MAVETMRFPRLRPNPFDAAIDADLRRREHAVTIMTRYGETKRECYCTATDGVSHHEFDWPWIGQDGKDHTNRG